MHLKIFTIYDQKIGAYIKPFFAQYTGEALRSFEQAAKDKNTTIGITPADFNLFEIGTFDSEDGIVYPLPIPFNLGNAVQWSLDQPSHTAPVAIPAGIQQVKLAEANNA